MVDELRKQKNKRHVTSKWIKTKLLLASPRTRIFVPDTRRMTRRSLLSMLESYQMVYIKPNKGTFGIGVMRVEREEAEAGFLYRFQTGTKVRSFRSYNKMYSVIRKLTRRRQYLVQKGIHLLKYRGRRFDIRVMVQQNPRRQWETTGIVGRLAAPKKVVTNIHNGGTVTAVGRLLRGHVSTDGRRQLAGRLGELGLVVAKRLHRKHPGLREIGLDVALDKTLHPWILEVNTSPDPFIFKKLKDKSIFRRIVRYAKAYGRL
jgi:glutathione synthase/RimK-type ligase-like ATP-grasp enzyme